MAKFGQACIDQVRRAAAELGYSPNYHARSLKRGKSNAIGFMLGLKTSVEWDLFWVTMMGGIIVGARELGYAFHLIGTEHKERPLETGLRLLADRMVDSLIVPPFLGTISDGMNAAPALMERIVMIQSRGPTPFPAVNLDATPGILDAVRRCHALGHRHFLWIGEGESVTQMWNREADFKRTVENLGGTCHFTAVPPLHFWPLEEPWKQRTQEASRIFLKYHQSHSDITAVFCRNESVAFGVYEAARQTGLRIPEQLSVVGFDNLRAVYALPPMSVIDHRIDDMGRQAARLAVALANGKKPDLGEKNILHVPSTFVERASTGPALAP